LGTTEEGPCQQRLLGKHIPDDPEHFVSGIRLSCWDSSSFLDCFSTLCDQVQEASKKEKQELYQLIWHVWDTYYPIGEQKDLAFSLGVLLYHMNYHREALGYYQHSLEHWDPDVSTFYNMALCHSALEQPEAALACIDQVLQLDPSSQSAKAMRIELQSQLNGSVPASYCQEC